MGILQAGSGEDGLVMTARISLSILVDATGICSRNKLTPVINGKEDRWKTAAYAKTEKLLPFRHQFSDIAPNLVIHGNQRLLRYGLALIARLMRSALLTLRADSSIAKV